MKRLKILVVDDDPISLMLISKIISTSNHARHAVGNALDAFEALSDKSYDAVVMDIEMPETNGFEASKFIRKLNSAYFESIPIVAMTAHKVEDVLKQVFSSGMNGVVNKPLDREAFIELITSLCAENYSG
jgi:CheY-like chemotaxis protein